MKKKGKLTKGERLELAILKEKGYSIRSIAKAMKRSPSTVSRELRRNIFQKENIYDPGRANHKSRVRKKYSRFQWRKINENRELRVFIISSLKKHWNPDEISGYMRRGNMPFYASKTAIYEWLYSGRGQKYCKYLYSNRYVKKRRKTKNGRVLIPNRIGISRRFVGATKRSRYGHLEVDTVVSGKRGKGALCVSVDRKSRYVSIEKLSNMKPNEMVENMKRIVEKTKVKSITFDNGIENRYHEEIGRPTFFCDPYSSWQKGSVENVNKMIRRYIPKGADISKISPIYIQHIEKLINGKPRKILGYRSALEIALYADIIKGECCD